MNKYLLNQTEDPILIKSVGINLEPSIAYDLPYELASVFIENSEVISLIQDGSVQVGCIDGLIGDPLEGEIYFRTMLGSQGFINDGPTVDRFDNSMVEDPYTNKKAVAFFMNMLTIMRDLYNNEDNPIYLEGHSQVLGADGWAADHAGRINNLEVIHSKMGWHNQEIYSYGKGRPLDLLVYYGYPNAFNSAVNGWVNERVAQDMAKYGLVVLGDGVQDPSHPDYSNTQVIIPRIKALNPLTKIFGYVSVNHTESSFQEKASNWNVLGVHGILMDEAGYDMGSPATNGREAFNSKVAIVQGFDSANICFVNAWNMDHIIGLVDDPSYPNTTWNPGLVASKLTHNDWYMLESFVVNTTTYTESIASKANWASRGLKAQAHRINYGINLASLGIINDDNPDGLGLFKFSFVSALMWSLEANGTSSNYYGASTAQVAYWVRSSISEMGRVWNLNASVHMDLNDVDNYLRYVDHGRFELDFSLGAQDSKIIKY